MSSMTSQSDIKDILLYPLINRKRIFYMITKKRKKIPSLKFMCVCIMELWIWLHRLARIVSVMTSSVSIISQHFELQEFYEYLSGRVDQKPKVSEIPMAILLSYSTSGITSGKKVCCDLKISKSRPFWQCQNITHSFNLTSDMKNHPKLY